MTLVIVFLFETMELLENWLQPHSCVTPLFSMMTVSLTSLKVVGVLTLTLGINGAQVMTN